jgi:hypothetical protein
MTEEEKLVSKPWKWPGEWVRDASWWRDVSTRAVAGLIVVFIVWGVGIAVGAFSAPGAVTGFLNVTLVLLALLAIFVVVYQVRVLVRHTQGRPVHKTDSKRTETMPAWLFLIHTLGTVGIVVLLVAETVNRLILGNESILFPSFNELTK